ncbi:hypothetical protein [Acidithiobacillus ferrooxidans]|uniref:hypothetical protein n=1 Tax=Acidithiobacillus ferrooxidans TaxID=920 RepID=UPI001D01E3BD|nr:hypothetical protein [Acidithiobacillus ferrooxidans]
METLKERILATEWAGYQWALQHPDATADELELAFSVSCRGTSIYGFLAGTWPFGVVEFIWCLLVLRKWYLLYARKENVAGKTE